MVHLDKNRSDSERAKKAFDTVAKAYKTLENSGSSGKCDEVVDEAKERVGQVMIEKRWKLRRSGSFADIEEDDPRKNNIKSLFEFETFVDLERL